MSRREAPYIEPPSQTLEYQEEDVVSELAEGDEVMEDAQGELEEEEGYSTCYSHKDS